MKSQPQRAGKCLQWDFPLNKSLLTTTFYPTVHLRHFAQNTPDHKSPPVLLQSTVLLLFLFSGSGGYPAKTWEPGIKCCWNSEHFRSLINVVHSFCLTLCLVSLLIKVFSVQCLASPLSLSIHPFLPPQNPKQFPMKISYFIY